MTTIPLLVRLILALGLVLGLIFGSVWMLRRFAPGGFARPTALPVPLMVVGRTWLGQRREVCAVRVADRLLLLGVTPMQVSLLSEIPNAFSDEPDDGPIRTSARSGAVTRHPRPAVIPGGPTDRHFAAGTSAPGGFGAELADLLGGMSRQQARLRGEDVG